TVARLLWAFRSPEPVVLVLAGDAAAVHGVEADGPLRAAASETGARATARTMAAPTPAAGNGTGPTARTGPTAGRARDIDDPDAFERALRGAL
ncbi:MAG: hypothetical protein ABEI11_00005, partial [Haloarculaceae archaeon]